MILLKLSDRQILVLTIKQLVIPLTPIIFVKIIYQGRSFVLVLGWLIFYSPDRLLLYNNSTL